MMSKENHYIHFPLCALTYPDTTKNICDMLISYGIVAYSKNLEKTIDLDDDDYTNAEDYLDKLNIKTSLYKNKNYIYVCLSCMKLKISLGSFEYTFKKYDKLNNYINDYEYRNGKEPFIRIHKSILFETRDNQFNERMFRIYCSILSVLGKKLFCRITIKNIAIRMLGYRSKKIFETVNKNDTLLTDRQIKTQIDKLVFKNLIDRITYKKRLTFYTTKYKGKAFETILINSISEKKHKKGKQALKNHFVSNEVEKRVNALDELFKLDLRLKLNN